MVNSSAIFSHSQCQWENLVGFIRSFIPIKWAGLQIWHCMLLYKLNEFSFQKVHISQFDCLLDQRESSTHLKVTNQDLLWQHKCVFLFTLQFESIAGVLLRIFSHWKSKTNFFSYFYSSRRQACFLMCANGGELIICLFLRGNQLWDCFEWSTDRWWRIQSWWWKTSFAFCSLTSQPPPWCIFPKYICSNCKLVYNQSFS